MVSFGTGEYGGKDGFKIICVKCGKAAELVPTHYYEDDDYKNMDRIPVELRCTCGNRFGTLIRRKDI